MESDLNDLKVEHEGLGIDLRLEIDSLNQAGLNADRETLKTLERLDADIVELDRRVNNRKVETRKARSDIDHLATITPRTARGRSRPRPRPRVALRWARAQGVPGPLAPPPPGTHQGPGRPIEGRGPRATRTRPLWGGEEEARGYPKASKATPRGVGSRRHRCVDAKPVGKLHRGAGGAGGVSRVDRSGGPTCPIGPDGRHCRWGA